MPIPLIAASLLQALLPVVTAQLGPRVQNAINKAQRLGGVALDPAYFDAAYGCQMEHVIFDAASPTPQYALQVTALQVLLDQSPAEKPPSTNTAQVYTWPCPGTV